MKKSTEKKKYAKKGELESLTNNKWFQNYWIIIAFAVISLLIHPVFTLLFLFTIIILMKGSLKKNNGYIKEHIRDESVITERKNKVTTLAEELDKIEQDINNRTELFQQYKEDIRKETEEKIREDMKDLITNAKKEATEVKQEAINEAQRIKQDAAGEAVHIVNDIEKYIEQRDQLLVDNEKTEKQLKTNNNKLIRAKAEVLGIKTLSEQFPLAIDYSKLEEDIREVSKFYDGESMLQNLIELDCHYKNSKELRKEMTRNKRELKKVLEAYVDRYTTKANKTIYQLMVIGLQAELQNILYTLTYAKLDEAKENVQALVRKYLTICANGNNSILPTITRFLSEIEPIFLEAIEIEHYYYAKREREKEEQQALREQMRQDAAERKALKQQQKKLEQEEEKFLAEMNRNKELLLSETDTGKISALEARIKELENQQNELEAKKEEITRLANGKAGYVYVISNLGSFGENMFKIGMTRRLNPQERVDELGSASVPFKFDVHALIFSNDAVGLENQLHQTLDGQRVNKVNFRKEFFETNVQELRGIVEEIDPTVEFKTTLVAQEYFQSQTIKNEQLEQTSDQVE